MDKKIIMLAMIIGSSIGGYLPTIWGSGIFSMSSVICGAAGGILGIWLSFKLLN
jgi:predicted esterase YcpF (UPF0227 family)